MNPETNTPIQPQPFQEPKKRTLKPLLYVFAVLVLLLASSGAVYAWQHGKVTDLETKLDNALAAEPSTDTTSQESDTKSTYGGIQQKARNSERQTDIATLQTQLEAYYNQNGYYPSFANLNDFTWRTTNLKQLDTDALHDPSETSPDIVQLATKPAAKVYAYEVTNSSGGSCETDAAQCARYTLTATFEGDVNGESTYVKQNHD